MYDIIIIGAGIIGSFLTHDLSKYQLKIAVIEKESDVANGATMANSAIIHSGHDPKEGTLKARFNRRGNEMYEDICKDLQVHFRRTSAFIVATNKEEEKSLDILYKQAVSRNIPAYYVPIEEARCKEAHLADAVCKVMELPTTGIIYPWEVAIALLEEAVENHVELYLDEKVCAIQKQEIGFEVITTKGSFQTKWIINAAGAYADNIYQMVSDKALFQITPRRGEYYVLDRMKKPLVNRVIYPIPSKAGKGILAVPTVHGNVLLGPNSEFIPNKEGINNTVEGLQLVKEKINKTIKDIPMHLVIRNFAGLRATGDRGDFIISEAEDIEHFINVACIESPGLTSAPAISEYILGEILQTRLEMKRLPSYKHRRAPIDLSKMTREQRNELVKKDATFGKMVCRCEQISEGEIIDVIRRPVGATTVKGVKKRVRPGMGRCQGGFCEPLVVEILARELHTSVLDIRMDGPDSRLLIGYTKGGDSDENI